MGTTSSRGADFGLPGLAPGDRAPDFVLLGRDGKFYAFCERVRGRPVLLWLGGEGGATALEGLVAAHADLEVAGVDIFVVLKRPPEGLADVPEDRARIALADVAGKVHEGFRHLFGEPGTGGRSRSCSTQTSACWRAWKPMTCAIPPGLRRGWSPHCRRPRRP